MDSRDSLLLSMRPEIPSAKIKEGMTDEESFQNETLRPIAKLQNDLLLLVFRNYATKHKSAFYDLNAEKKLDYIENAIQKDIKFRNSLKGIIIGQFTLEEYEKYINNSSALNKRMMNIVKESGVVFSSVKTRTTDREFREIRKRLEKLTSEQKNILIHGDLNSQKQTAFLAVCKHYAFIRDFTIEVMRDKMLVYDYRLHESDYNSFINSKILLHPELEAFSESTQKKAKQVMFRILEQAGIINNAIEKTILPQILQQEIITAIVKDDPAWLKIFMMSDRDIKQIRH